MGLVQIVKQAMEGRRANAMRRYRELIDKGDKVTEAESQLFIELAEELGRNPKQVESDINTLAEFQKLQALAQNAAGIEAEREAARLNREKQNRHLGELAATFAAEKRRLWELQNVEDRTGYAVRAAMDAPRKLDELRNANPDILQGA